MSICKGIKKNGVKCSYKAKLNGYCGIHKKQYIKVEEVKEIEETKRVYWDYTKKINKITNGIFIKRELTETDIYFKRTKCENCGIKGNNQINSICKLCIKQPFIKELKMKNIKKVKKETKKERDEREVQEQMDSLFGGLTKEEEEAKCMEIMTGIMKITEKHMAKDNIKEMIECYRNGEYTIKRFNDTELPEKVDIKDSLQEYILYNTTKHWNKCPFDFILIPNISTMDLSMGGFFSSYAFSKYNIDNEMITL